MRRPFFVFFSFWSLLLASSRAAAPAGSEALLVIVGDQHSAYERTAQLVAQVDRLRAENPGLPMAILVDGDVFEFGNGLARRSAGAIDFAMLAAFARRAPTILNLGNHEPEFYDLAETVARVQATGVTVVSNITHRVTGKPFAPAFARLKLGERDAMIVGVTTDVLATFRVAVRPTLDLADPVIWARRFFPQLLPLASVKIVLSHAGLEADRAMLPLVPDGTLFAGAHDHLRFVHRENRTAYIHSGSWNAFFTVAFLHFDARGASWEIQQQPIALDDPADPELAAVIRETRARYAAPEDAAIVGHLPRALTADEAAQFATDALRVAAKVDAAFIGHTTFGGGLPAGDISRAAFDACLRFDGTVFIGEISGAQLSELLAAANETPDTPFEKRPGDFLVAAGPAAIVPEQRYRIAVTDWIARNPGKYLGAAKIPFVEHPELRVKEILRQALDTPDPLPAASATPAP
jgi:5'-nucleotidase/UDP-sugar diphosphatase